MSHSKRNTSLAFFTSHERAEVAKSWGSRSARLTKESFLAFGSCRLCLLPARDPVSCPSHGHLFCRECAMSNLLAQNKEIKRLRKEAERRKLEDEEEKEVEKAVAKARVVEEFERVQNGNEGDLRGLKRKIDENEHGPVRYAIGGSGDKSKRHESEKNDSRGELPSFWVPSETPENRKSDVKVIKQHPTCPAAAKDDSHDFSLRTLISVKFSETSSSAAHDGLIQICPSCNKVLSNSTKAVLAKPCGHVLCQACSDKFQRLPEQLAHQNEGQDSILCYVCQEDITPSGRKKRTKDTKAGGRLKDATAEKGLVVLSAEGTGFAGGGKNIVKKDGVVFQC